MIDVRDVELCMDMVYAEFEKQIRAQSDAMGLDESQIRGRDQLFAIVSEYKAHVIRTVKGLELSRLEKMTEDMTEVKE